MTKKTFHEVYFFFFFATLTSTLLSKYFGPFDHSSMLSYMVRLPRLDDMGSCSTSNSIHAVSCLSLTFAQHNVYDGYRGHIDVVMPPLPKNVSTSNSGNAVHKLLISAVVNKLLAEKTSAG